MAGGDEELKVRSLVLSETMKKNVGGQPLRSIELWGRSIDREEDQEDSGPAKGEQVQRQALQ